MSKDELVRDHKPSIDRIYAAVVFSRLALLLLALTITTNPAYSSVTMEQYDKIKVGMSFLDATAILGKPDGELARSGYAGHEIVIYKWKGTSLSASMNITFMDAKVQNKDQSGLASPGTSSVTMEQYEKIKIGMSFLDATAILGKPDRELARSEFADQEIVMYEWKGTSLGANMNITFVDAKVQKKAQFGLAGPGTSSVTMEQYEKIKVGMSFLDATSILGKPDEEFARGEYAGQEIVKYKWKGTYLGANMNITFVDAKVNTKAQFGLR